MGAELEDFTYRWRLDLQAVLAGILQEQVPELSEGAADAAALAVLDRLRSDDVTNDFAGSIHMALVSAAAAATERSDLFREVFSDSGVTAEVAAAAVQFRFRTDRGEPFTLADAARVHAQLRKIRYRGWSFELVAIGPSLGVKAIADFDDSRTAGRTFRTSRIAAIRGADVIGAAFRAVMEIEEHEARERFYVSDRLALDPHSASAAFPPLNECNVSGGADQSTY